MKRLGRDAAELTALADHPPTTLAGTSPVTSPFDVLGQAATAPQVR
ncbi:hypothetical protein ACIRQQ_47620 [Streptomyces fuscichromogenes]